jgi:hypothetical protein
VSAFLELVRDNSAIFGAIWSLVITLAFKLITDRKTFYETKPYISVNPYFFLDEYPSDTGTIRYIEIGNYGKSTAVNVVISFVCIRTWESPRVKEKILIDKYTLRHLPPSGVKKYRRPNITIAIPRECYPELVTVSYEFQGKRHAEDFRLFPENQKDRGYELKEFGSSEGQ